ncbi:MAG: SDR family oxidoreductase [Candidatus Hydrogenedentes bacterium]|nr:SDR family oxidoreductase [Candidatus Hydrogenedentota bacterium]
MKLKGKTALITGAGRGIGRSIALAFAREGCHIALAARTPTELDHTAVDISALGVTALPIVCDVTRTEDISRTVSTTLDTFGHVDILVNNAGEARFKPVYQLSLEEWTQALNVNVTSAFLFVQGVLPGMMTRRSGRIINISSVTGIKALPEQAAYGAAKHAMNSLTKSLNLELRDYNIAAHALCPGGVDTKLSQDAMPHRDKSEWMQPEDIAHTALYLATLSSHMAVDIISMRRFAGDPLA